MFLFFFFKQKTAYEVRISDWSSDVCSSDLVGEQAFAVLRILKRRLAARAGARNRADRHFAVADADEDFGRGADQGKARQVQIIEEGRGVDPPERPVKIDRRQRKGRGEALRQNHLK